MVSLAAAVTSRAAAAVERQVSSHGVKIALRHWGGGSGGGRGDGGNGIGAMTGKRRILALHGWLDNAATFEMLGPALAEDGYEVVAMDFPGHGQSGRAGPNSWYAFIEMADVVMEVLEQLGWSEGFSLLGHSMGGGVATLVAGTYPDKVTRCIMLDSLGPMTLPSEDAPSLLKRGIEARRKVREVLARSEDGRMGLEWPSLDSCVKARVGAATSMPGSQTLSYAAAEKLMLRGTRRASPGGTGFFVTSDPRLKCYSLQYFSEESILAWLRAIKCPCLCLMAADGLPFVSPLNEKRKDVLRANPLCSMALLPGSHHFHLDEDSAPEVIRRVKDFLASS